MCVAVGACGRKCTDMFEGAVREGSNQGTMTGSRHKRSTPPPTQDEGQGGAIHRQLAHRRDVSQGVGVLQGRQEGGGGRSVTAETWLCHGGSGAVGLQHIRPSACQGSRRRCQSAGASFGRMRQGQ